jgi:predicted DNA-binding transcriptional regulator AlpA
MNLYCTKKAATFLSVSPRTLERHRLTGTGPAFVKIGKLVRYSEHDMLAWIQQSTHTSTSAQDSHTARMPARASG